MIVLQRHQVQNSYKQINPSAEIQYVGLLLFFFRIILFESNNVQWHRYKIGPSDIIEAKYCYCPRVTYGTHNLMCSFAPQARVTRALYFTVVIAY